MIVRYGQYSCATETGIHLIHGGGSIVENVNFHNNKVGIRIQSNNNYLNYSYFNDYINIIYFRSAILFGIFI